MVLKTRTPRLSIPWHTNPRIRWVYPLAGLRPTSQDKINEPSYDGTVWEIVDVPPRLGGKIQLKRFRGDGVSMDESFLLNCGTKRFPVFTQEDKGRLISLHGADDANDVTLIESSGKGEPRKMDWKEARHTEVAKPLFITFVEEKIKG